MTLAPALRSVSACAARASTDTPASFINAALPSATARPARRPRTPMPLLDSKPSGALERETALARGANDRGRQGMLAALVDARGQAQHLVLAMAGGGDHPVQGRLAFGQGAGLVDDQGVDLAQVLDRRRIAKEDALRRRLAAGHHDRHRRGEAERTGAGDDEHGHGVDQAPDPARLGAVQAPGEERQDGNGDHADDEPARHLVGHALHRRPAALGLGDHLHDLREHGLRADRLGAHDEGAARVHRRADQLVARRASSPGSARRSASTRRRRCCLRRRCRRPAPSRRGAPAARRPDGHGRAARPSRCRRR